MLRISDTAVPAEETSCAPDGVHQSWPARLRAWWPELALMALFAFLVLWRLGHYHLWTDEAETAVFAKSILRFGVPMGFDGRNLIEIYGGMLLNPKMVNVWSPWLQYYLGAGSMALFGTGNLAARLPFALCGIASVVFAYLFARRHYNRPVALTALALMATNVQFILFLRQARYYGPMVLLMSAYIWLYGRSVPRSLPAYLGAGLISLLAFFTNPLVGAICLGSFLIAAFLTGDRSKALRYALIPAPAVLAAAAGYLVWVRRDGVPPDMVLFRNLDPSNFLALFDRFLGDYNLLSLLPASVVLIGFIFLWGKVRKRPWAAQAHSFRLDLLPAGTVLLATVLTALLSIHPPSHANSDIRYALPLFPLLLILQASFLVRVITLHRIAGLVLLFVACTTNLLTFHPPTSHLVRYARENLFPFPNPVKEAIAILDQETNPDDTLLVTPNYMLLPVYYYHSDRLLLTNAIGPENKTILPFQPDLPRHTYAQDFLPKWILRFGASEGVKEEHLESWWEKIPLERYEIVRTGGCGVDKSRPELFWRTFTHETGCTRTRSLVLMRLREEPGQETSVP